MTMFDFNKVQEVRLSKGAHKSPEQGMCFMEMAAWFAGEEHSDKPACVSPALGSLGIAINDSMANRERDEALKPMIPHVVGTFDEKAETARIEYICLRAFNYVCGFVAPEFVRRHGPAKSFHDARERARHLHEAGRHSSYIASKYHYDTTLALSYAMGSQRNQFQEQLYATIERLFVMRIPYLGELSPTASAVMNATVNYPNIENARAAGGVFSLMGEIVPDWSAAIDTLREAIKIGRHDGFDIVVNLEARHVALRELVDA